MKKKKKKRKKLSSHFLHRIFRILEYIFYLICKLVRDHRTLFYPPTPVKMRPIRQDDGGGTLLFSPYQIDDSSMHAFTCFRVTETLSSGAYSCMPCLLLLVHSIISSMKLTGGTVMKS